MTKPMMDLRELVEKSGDADLRGGSGNLNSMVR
jgi:hypothetical protein